MKITQEGPDQRQAVLNIEMEPEDLEKYLDRAYRRLVQRMTVPGFRRGKAPRAILERMLGREALLNEALDSLVSGATTEAVQEQGLEVSAQPQVEVLGTDPVVLKATVPLIPRVELGDYGSLRIPQEAVSVEEEQVQQALEEIRLDAAPWEPVERPVQMGDLVVLDGAGSADGRTIFDQKAAAYVVSQDPVPLPGFGAALEGMSSGESQEFALDIPEDHSDQGLAGKACQITVAVKEVKERRLPDLDDEFARGVGEGYDTLEALKEDVRNRLQATLENQAKRNYEDQAVEQLLESTQVELPPLLIEREIEHLLEEQRSGAQSQVGRQVELDEYISALGKSQEELQEELRPRAEERLGRSAVLSRIAEEEDVQVPEEAVEGEIAQMVQEAGRRGNEVRRLFADPRQRELLARALRTRRTIEHLASIARGEVEATTVKPGPQSEEESAAETALTSSEDQS